MPWYCWLIVALGTTLCVGGGIIAAMAEEKTHRVLYEMDQIVAQANKSN